MNPEVSITAKKGHYIVHFYNNGSECNLVAKTLQEAIDLANGFLRSVAKNSATPVPAE